MDKELRRSLLILAAAAELHAQPPRVTDIHPLDRPSSRGARLKVGPVAASGLDNPAAAAGRAELLLNDISIGIGRPTAIKHANGFGLTHDASAVCDGG